MMAGWDVFLGIVVSLRALVRFIEKLNKEDVGASQLIDRRFGSLQDRAVLQMLRNRKDADSHWKRRRTDDAMTEEEKTAYDDALSSFLERISLGGDERVDSYSDVDEDENDHDEDYDINETESERCRASELMKEVCRMYHLPEICVCDERMSREYDSDGVLVYAAGKWRQKRGDAELGNGFGISAVRIDPDFFVVSDDEKLAFALIAALFELVPQPPHSLEGPDFADREGERTLKPAWIQTAHASVG